MQRLRSGPLQLPIVSISADSGSSSLILTAVSMGNSRRFSPRLRRHPFLGAWDHSLISSQVPIFTMMESLCRLSIAAKSRGGGRAENFN